MSELKKYKCPVCNKLMKACDSLGDAKFCEELIDDFKDDRISEHEFAKKLDEKFGGAIQEEFKK